MSEASSLVVSCQCGAKLRVPANAAGRRAKCPKCGFKIAIPANDAVDAVDAVAPAMPETAPAEDEDDELLNDFMKLESSADATSTASLQDSQKTCPSCQSPIARDAARCPMCGHGAASPSGAGAAALAGGQAKAKVTQFAAGGSRLLMGCVVSGIGALIGAGVWYGVVIGTGYEVGYIAWGLGLAAGFGMMMGSNEQSTRAGVLAVVMSLVGIFAAKGMIYNHYVGEVDGVNAERLKAGALAVAECQAPLNLAEAPPWDDRQSDCYTHLNRVQEMADDAFEGEYTRLQHWNDVDRWADEAQVRAYLINYSANTAAAEHFGEETYDEEDEGEDVEAWSAAEQNIWREQQALAVTRVDAMTPEARLAEARAHQAEAMRKFDDLARTIQAQTGIGSTLFFESMFDWMDILFVLLAVGSAYKLAGGGATE